MRTLKIFGILAVAGLTATAALAYVPASQHAATHAVSQKDISAARAMLKLADQHADNCKWNYDQCVKACDGMASCTNQCTTNYNGCMQNGQ